MTTTKPPLHFVAPPAALAKVLAVEPAQTHARAEGAADALLPRPGRGAAALEQAVAELGQPVDPRQPGAQDLVWALINSKAFLFNR